MGLTVASELIQEQCLFWLFTSQPACGKLARVYRDHESFRYGRRRSLLPSIDIVWRFQTPPRLMP